MPLRPEALLSHGDHLRALIRGLLFDEHEVEDVVQECWQRAIEQGPREPGALGAWLRTVARNVAHNRRRSRTRRQRRELESAQSEQVTSTVELVAREELRSKVIDAVLALEQPYQDVVLRRYIDGLEPSQIASEQGVPAATVRTQLRRGLQRLRARLDSEHGGDREAWSLAAIPMALPRLRPRILPQSWFGSAAGASRLILAGLMLGLVTVGSILFWLDRDGGSAEPVPEQQVAMAGAAADVADATRVSPAENAPLRIERATREAEQGVPPARVAFAGRLVDDAGQPLVGASLRIVGLDTFELMQGGQGAARFDWNERAPVIVGGRTDAKGRFELGDLPPAALCFLRARSQDSSWRLWRMLEASPLPGETHSLGDIEMLRACTLEGTVQDARGEALAGAHVHAVDLPAALMMFVPMPRLPLPLGSPGAQLITRGEQPRVIPLPGWAGSLQEMLPIASTRSDAEGRYRLEGVPPGTVTVLVQAEGYPTLARSTRSRIDRVRRVPAMRMRPGPVLRGVVRDRDGVPVPGAELIVAPLGAMDGIALATLPGLADEQGRFEIEGLPRGQALLAARRGPGHAWHVASPRPVAARHSVLLPAMRSLRILRPADAQRLQLQLFGGQPRGELLHAGLLPGLEREWAWKGAALELALEAAPHRLLVRASGSVTRSFEISSEQKELRLDLPMAELRHLRVLDSGGQAVPHARVWTLPSQDFERLSALPLRSYVPRFEFVPEFHGYTDVEGRISLKGLGSGELRVRVEHPLWGYAKLDLEKLPADRDAELVLRYAGLSRLRGQVTELGVPAELGAWTVLLDDQRSKFELGLDYGMPRWLRTDAEGAFAVPALPASRWLVQALPGLGQVDSFGAVLRYLQKHRDDLKLFRYERRTLAAGSEESVALETRPGEQLPASEGAHVSGTISVDGATLPGMRVELDMGWRARSLQRELDGSGRFDFGVVAPGKRTLTVLDPEGRRWASRSLELKKGGERELQIAFETASLNARVFLPDGRPAREARLSVQELHTHEHKPRWGAGMSLVTDRQGRVAIARLPAGRYVIEASMPRGYARRELHLGPAQQREQRFELERRFVLRGKVPAKLRASSGPFGPLLTIVAHDRSYQGIARFERDGSFEFDGLRGGGYTLLLRTSVSTPGGGWESQDVEIGRIELARDQLDWRPRSGH
jgi:RNA polymerase sigma factor (sigma-70 family)